MTTEIATQDQLQEIILSGSEILQSSQLRVSKAISVGDKLLAEIQEKGMSTDMDERCNKFLVNCRNAKSEIETQRKPITAFFDTIRKQFTENEAKLDPKKLDSHPAKIQAYRDKWVAKLRAEEAEKQRIAQAKIDKENEIIDIKASLEVQLSTYVNNHIAERKQKLQDSFNKITLENLEEKSKALKTLAIEYQKSHFQAFSPNWLRKHVTQEETSVLLDEFIASKDFNLIAAVVVDEIRKFKEELIEKLPSLKKSLEDMAKAGEAEKARLAKEKQEREAAAAKKLQEEAEAKIKSDQEAAEVKKTAEQTNALMNNLELNDTVAPETRDGFKITLINKPAIAEIFTFWFQREGMTLSLEELEKKSITQMKAYCEKVAHKSGDMIVSDNLKYEPVYKAVNRK
ncbi:hypothetical protein [Flavobacterium sp. UMI-01]|uniref:hypothetical protein n=1 Tax=Flavobacterium sp. UMI-01 TaxID=1441053 RepID=UPI001C7D5565|nr:hypothetical protein [Flavobacterium sp. UMI-01]GIZ08335.1 hypothetical protein FUMI01_10620 [Flavobacterium sp. UMI-01]